MFRLFFILVLLFQTTLCLAQTSPNYKLTEYVFNSGGNPENGVVLESPNYSISLDSLGQTITATSMMSGSYSSEAGFPYAYPPPGEVYNLQILTPTQLTWYPESSIGSYNVYRGQIGDLASGYGSCLDMAVTDEQYKDVAPYSGQAYFYLITASNRIAEEGTMGYTSSGSERNNSNPCY